MTILRWLHWLSLRPSLIRVINREFQGGGRQDQLDARSASPSDPRAIMIDPSPAGHVHAFEAWVTFHHAPIGPWPQHTTFMVFTCQQAGCRALEIFPQSNFELCTPEFKKHFRASATTAGWEPPLGPLPPGVPDPRD